jgi:hypothetical protein
VLAALAAERGLAMRAQRDNVTAAQRADGHYPSEWVVMARTDAALGSLAAQAVWERPVPAAGSRVWTDDFSDIVSVLKTNRR